MGIGELAKKLPDIAGFDGAAEHPEPGMNTFLSLAYQSAGALETIIKTMAEGDISAEDVAGALDAVTQHQEVMRSLGTQYHIEQIKRDGDDDKLSARITQLESERAELEKELYTDPVTGGNNRKAFMKEWGQAIEEMRYNPERSDILIFIDLDGFKQLNDALGHEVGDDALYQADQKLKAIRPIINGRVDRDIEMDSTVARLGGDEMVWRFKIEDGEDVSPETLASQIRAAFDGLVYWDDQDNAYPIGASIGVSVQNAKDINGRDVGEYQTESLIAADKAMYVDKKHKKPRQERSESNAMLGADVIDPVEGQAAMEMFGIEPD